MADERIGDLPRHRKALEEADALLALTKIAKAIEPFLPAQAKKALAAVDPQKLADLRGEMKRLASLPDRFNGHFADRGWISFEAMNGEVAALAVALADGGKVDEAEEVLAAQWTTDRIRLHIGQLKRVEAFPPRWRLAVDAEELYGQEKYHASTLLVLAVLDGVVQEISARYLGVNQNFSAEKTVLQAWDSIAGHSTGLSKLKELMLRPRKKTNTEPITIPFRHGIVHGMDVNFNSRLVAAKTWAALFAVGEWAYLAQQGQLSEPPRAAPKTMVDEWREIAGTMEKTEALKQALKDFEPRTIWQEGRIPPSGTPEDYGTGTPERALVEFLTFWKARNFGHMARGITALGAKAESPSDLRTWFENKTLLGFEITRVVDQSPARSVVSVRVHVRGRMQEWTSNPDVVMIKKLDSGDREELRTTPWTFTNYYELAREPRSAPPPAEKDGPAP